MIRSLSSVVISSLVALSLSTTVGCASRSNGGGSDDGTAAAGSDSTQVESDTESFGSMFASSGSDGSLAPSDFSGGSLSTQGLGGAASGFPNLYPAGCATETSDIPSKTNTYTFDSCTGPYGFSHIKGTVTVTWSSTGPNNLTLNFSATDFEINKATIATWKATAVITATGDARDMQWSGQFAGTTGGGRAFSRTNTKDIKWTAGQQCIAIDGQSTGNVTGKNLTTKVISYQRCAASCPEANSEINIHNDDNGNDVDIVFQGGAKADVTVTANGRTGSVDVPLVCQ